MLKTQPKSMHGSVVTCPLDKTQPRPDEAEGGRDQKAKDYRTCQSPLVHSPEEHALPLSYLLKLVASSKISNYNKGSCLGEGAGLGRREVAPGQGPVGGGVRQKAGTALHLEELMSCVLYQRKKVLSPGAGLLNLTHDEGKKQATPWKGFALSSSFKSVVNCELRAVWPQKPPKVPNPTL